MPRPVILVSNDDGIHAEGLLALEAALAPLGTVVTVAPENEQSAMSHAMTLSRPLRLRQVSATRYAVDGTPVDCVYVGLHLPDVLPARPAVVVSGINHGLNLGSDVFYSGTVAAAREGALRGVPAVAVSLASLGDRTVAGALAARVVAALLAQRAEKQAPPALLNVNVPAGPVRGVLATRLGVRLYDEIVEMRTDPRGRQYLWLGGPSVRHPPSEGTDTAAHESGYASVTPLSVELYREDHVELARTVAAAAQTRPSAPRRRAASASTSASTRTSTSVPARGASAAGARSRRKGE